MSAASIAIIGASPDRGKYSNRAVRAYHARGYHVYPIHPRETLIENLPTYRSVRDVPVAHLDRVSFYVPPVIGLEVLDGLMGLSIGEIWLNPGADAPEVIAKAKELGFNVVVGCSLIAAGWQDD